MKSELSELSREELSDALEDSAVRIALPDGVIEPHDLALRDRAERELLEGREVWDRIVRPVAWKLVALNEHRQRTLRALAPEDHERLWWWSDGAGVAPSAISALSEAAQLVARFPAARARFEALVNAEATWIARPRTVAKIATLRAWLQRGDALPLAAATSDERLVLETSDLEVSFVAPARLVVDLLSDRREDGVPSLRSASGAVVAGAVVPGAEERFAFDLPAALLDDSEVSLVVPLATGDIVLVLA